MVLGYSGVYRGVVVDSDDPLRQRRLNVAVPEVYGDAVTVWALPLYDVDGIALPAPGDAVLVSFEHGDTDRPVWQPDGTTDAHDGPSPRGFVGKYRGRVLDADDPLAARRLMVAVPEVTPEPSWAAASPDVGHLDLPAVDAEVWIEYDQGDAAYPVWVGIV